MTQLRVLAPIRYLWTFNGPRHSRHLVERRGFLPTNWISKKIEGVTIINPFPPRRFDLIHAFNRVPAGTTPFIIGFESHLPRAYGLERTGYYRHLCRILAGPRCRGIIAISEHARGVFQATHKDSPYRDELFSKLSVRLPNYELPADGDPLDGKGVEPLRVSFVGNHFARKGGCVAVKVAELALARKLPVEVEIASSMQVGAPTWTDPLSETFFEPYFALLQLPNVRAHGPLPTSDVNAMLRRSHLSFLPTFSDTFGFSTIEAMSNWSPVVATRQGALPEFIVHRDNGILLELPTSDLGEWVHAASPSRGEAWYEKMYAEEIDRLAHEALGEVERLIEEPRLLWDMRRQARSTAEERFCSRAASEFWDEYYLRAVDGWSRNHVFSTA